MKKAIQLLLITIMALCMFGCSHEQDHDIYILYTNDVHCAAEGNIGYAGVKYFKDSYVNSHTYVAMVDCGDFASGGPIGQYREGEEIVMLMNDCGYDVAVMGNQDFIYGMDAAVSMIEQAKFSIVGCNIKYTGSNSNRLNGISPYVIKKFGHTKVAFIGVMTPDTLIETKPSHKAFMEDGALVYSMYEGNDGQDFYDQVQKTVDSIRKKVDYVIVLSHLGIESKSEPYTSFSLITNTTGIDVVIDAHSHTVNFGEFLPNKDGEDVVLTQTGKELEYVGELILRKDHTYSTVLYPNVDGKDPFIEAEINDINEAIKQ